MLQNIYANGASQGRLPGIHRRILAFAAQDVARGSRLRHVHSPCYGKRRRIYTRQNSGACPAKLVLRGSLPNAAVNEAYDGAGYIRSVLAPMSGPLMAVDCH
jgi:hypothetical protein